MYMNGVFNVNCLDHSAEPHISLKGREESLSSFSIRPCSDKLVHLPQLGVPLSVCSSTVWMKAISFMFHSIHGSSLSGTAKKRHERFSVLGRLLNRAVAAWDN